MEALSPTMEEGRLVKWLKAEGDAVKNGDVLAEVETDKAVMELVARGEGLLRKRLINEGDAAPVGTLVGVIGTRDEDIGALVGGSAGCFCAAAARGGCRGQRSGRCCSCRCCRESGRFCRTARHTRSTGCGAAPPPPVPTANAGRTIASPLAKRLADERGLDLARVAGSGPGGRIIKRDVEAAIAAPEARQRRGSSAGHAAAASGADYDDLPLTLIRKTIARRLSESIGPIPTFYLTAEFDLQRKASELRAGDGRHGR